MIADPDRKVADLYDMIHPNALDNLTVRSVFVIGPDDKVKLTLQLTAQHQVATPANWQHGDQVIISGAVSDEQAKEKYPQGWTTLRPYLRLVDQPGA